MLQLKYKTKLIHLKLNIKTRKLLLKLLKLFKPVYPIYLALILLYI